jgi:hypothetical protein
VLLRPRPVVGVAAMGAAAEAVPDVEERGAEEMQPANLLQLQAGARRRRRRLRLLPSHV